MAKIKVLTASALAIALISCHRLDTLSVIDNPYGEGLIIDNIYGNGRVICVVRKVSSKCSPSNANVVVKEAVDYSDVVVGWGVDNNVNVRVNRGRVTHIDSSALDGAVKVVVQ